MAAPVAPSVAATAPAQPVAAPSIDLTVQFQSGSAELTPEAMRTLDELGRALSHEALAAYRFRIEGHTDTTGSRSANMSLSQARAARVAEYLQSRFGVAAARLEPVGRGQETLKVQTPDQTPEPRNRRVQVINIGA
jgi:outer membrane protein OmpA-like peptidoglycan-associated protein